MERLKILNLKNEIGFLINFLGILIFLRKNFFFKRFFFEKIFFVFLFLTLKSLVLFGVKKYDIKNLIKFGVRYISHLYNKKP